MVFTRCAGIVVGILICLILRPSLAQQTPSNATTLPVGSCTATIPCGNGACCNGDSGFCGFGPMFCAAVAQGGPCTSNCDALAECGPFAAASNRTCPLNVCCSQFGFCGTTDDFCGAGCLSNCNPPAPASCGADAETALERRIGYYESWAAGRPCDAYTPEQISAETLTHVNFAFALISSSFEIIEMSPGDSNLWVRTTALKARNPALKVFLSIGGWTFNDPPTQHIFSQLVSTDTNILKFTVSALQTLQAYGFDGIDIDWEYPAAQDRGGVPADTGRYTVFMRQVKLAFVPLGYGLTFTAPSSYWYLQHFDLPGLMEWTDWVNVMTYDLHGVWDGVDPFIGKIVLAHTNLTEIKQTMQLFANVKIDPSQMVLGIGFYGRSFQLVDSQCSAPGCGFLGGAFPGPCSLNSGTLMFSEIERVLAANNLNPVYDDVDAVKYVSWNEDQWVSYDDAQTLQQKLEYANSICLGGTMIWSLDQDDTSYTALSGLYASLDINKPSRVETGNLCQITGCGQDCPPGYTFMTTLTSNPAVSETCSTSTPAKLCCPPGQVPQHCHWSGGGGSTCNAQCDTGEIVLALDSTGDDGKPTCIQGTKAYCCQSGERDADKCYKASCDSTSCRSGYTIQTHVVQGSGPTETTCIGTVGRFLLPICPITICKSNDVPVCCTEDSGYTGCHWVGDPPNCFNSVCEAGQVAVFSDLQGDAPQACTKNKRLYCCDPPQNDALPVPTDWVFPSQSPVGGSTYNVDEPATFTVDFDDTTDPNNTGDDGLENDTPFGEVFISSPNSGSVSSLDLASNWVIVNCSPSSDQPQQVAAYCSKSIDDPNSGCGHVFIGQATHTIVRMPQTCGLGPYARIVSLDVHEDQSILSPYHASQKQSQVYALHFDYNFAVIPEENGPVLMRADLTNLPGYWDAMINSAPDSGTTSTRRNIKRDFHQPEELDKRWFGPFDSWLKKITTITNSNSLSRNLHWSDSYTIFHQEEQCPHFMSSLDISVSGQATFSTSFGYYLEATVVPPEIQQAYVFVRAEAGANATFTIEALAGVDFSSDRSELVSFGFPGLYYPGLLTLGPSLHIYGQLIGELSMSGKLTTTVGYNFPSVDWAFGKQDSNNDEEPGFVPVNFNQFSRGFGPATFDVNINLEGNLEIHVIPSFQLGINVLGGAVLDAQVFLEADLFAGVGINGSVSLSSAPKFCVNPHYGSNLNAGITGSLLFWRPNPLSVNLFSAENSFFETCWSSENQGDPTDTLRRREGATQVYNAIGAQEGTLQDRHPHVLDIPAYLETTLPPGNVTHTRPKIVSQKVPSRRGKQENIISKRANVPFLPGGLFCPAEGNEIIDTASGQKRCDLYEADLDTDQSGDRLARRDFELLDEVLKDAMPSKPNLTSRALPPFHILDSQKSSLKSCSNFVTIPNYDRVPISGYYDFNLPAALSPQIGYYNVIPVNLQNSDGSPGLVVRPGVSVYGREHIYEESLAATFIDYLKQQIDLYDGTSWCNWVRTNLQRSPAYFGESLFNRVGACYPNNNVDGSSMPALESNANTAKNLAMFDGERQLDPSLGASKNFRRTAPFSNYCGTAQVGYIRSVAAVLSYMNEFAIRDQFLTTNTCVKMAWTDWYNAYLTANDISNNAPNRANVNVPNLYDNYIHLVIGNMPTYLRGQVQNLIAACDLNADNTVTPPADPIDISFNVLIDDKNAGINIARNLLDRNGVIAYAMDETVTKADLTSSILGEIQGGITWLNQLPTH